MFVGSNFREFREFRGFSVDLPKLNPIKKLAPTKNIPQKSTHWSHYEFQLKSLPTPSFIDHTMSFN